MQYHLQILKTAGDIMADAGWKKLCREIMDERDPEKLFALADALNRVLDHPHLKRDESVETFGNVPVC